MPADIEKMASALEQIKKDSERFYTDSNALQRMFNSIDLTTLSTSDSAESVKSFVEKVNTFGTDYHQLKNVGGICV